MAVPKTTKQCDIKLKSLKKKIADVEKRKKALVIAAKKKPAKKKAKKKKRR